METEIKKRFSLYTNFNKKLGSLVVHVPFKTLGKKEMKEIFKNELLNTLSCIDRFECVRFDKRVVDFLVSKWESSEIIKKMNGRAFHKYIYPTFVDEEIQRTKNLLKVKGKKRHLKLAIKKNGDKDFLKADLAFEFKKLNKKDL
ncbi:hypothetical protein MHBO_001961 [Bonamia ostreae]|uniref:Uncharacterized protein n=1 Tax=Bonamia ostreae TaxID=126728 RepID=A0ABV2ALB1_9EUKA